MMSSARGERVMAAAAILRNLQAVPNVKVELSRLDLGLTTAVWNEPKNPAMTLATIVEIRRDLVVMANRPGMWQLRMALVGVVELLMPDK